MIDTSIEPTILTDHKAITFKLDVNRDRQGQNKDYWKLNSSLLNNEEFKVEVITLLNKYWIQANNFGKSWELFKFEIRNMAIKIGKKLAKNGKKKNPK